MDTLKRREDILSIISKSTYPVSGAALAEKMQVSRQIIVSDIAHLKADGNDILSTNKGYILNQPKRAQRVFKVFHSDEDLGDELFAVVEAGARIEDVYVWHKIYGKIVGRLDISSRRDVCEYLESLRTGRSAPLKNVTSGYHYHTVTAENEEILDRVEKILSQKGFLVKEEE